MTSRMVEATALSSEKKSDKSNGSVDQRAQFMANLDGTASATKGLKRERGAGRNMRLFPFGIAIQSLHLTATLPATEVLRMLKRGRNQGVDNTTGCRVCARDLDFTDDQGGNN